ncbi:MAG: serpin family protein [Spirosomataceae bacterium]
MKRIQFLTLITLMLLGYNCTQSESINPVGGDKLTGVSARFATQSSAFAFDLFKQHNKSENNKNVVLSPLSLNIALGMLLNGANGTTANEIKQALRQDGILLDDINQTYLTLLNGLPKVDNNVTVNIANSVWQNDRYTAESAFTNTLNHYFLSQTYPFDSTKPDEAKNKINSWVSDKTQGKITNLIDQVTSDSFLFLLNAVYFKGTWKYQFKTSDTQDASFAVSEGKNVTVKMMRQTAPLRVAQGTNYAAFELPYSNGDYAMTIVLPDRNVSIDGFIDSFDTNAWKSLQTNLTERREEVGLPRFELNYDASLNATLNALGMKQAFTAAADLSKISKSIGLMVSKVKQKTYLKVDEVGTEAAAATSIGVVVTSMPLRNYICDRPFLVVISEKNSDTVLFIGKIQNPLGS